MMVSHDSTRVRAPDNLNKLFQPTGLQAAVHIDAASPNPIGRYDEDPKAGSAPCQDKMEEIM